jgi:hypothetical protein
MCPHHHTTTTSLVIILKQQQSGMYTQHHDTTMVTTCGQHVAWLDVVCAESACAIGTLHNMHNTLYM